MGMRFELVGGRRKAVAVRETAKDTQQRCVTLMCVLDHLALKPGATPFPSVDLALMPTYVEAQIHGEVSFATDIDELVVHSIEATQATSVWLKLFSERFAVPVKRYFTGGAFARF